MSFSEETRIKAKEKALIPFYKDFDLIRQIAEGRFSTITAFRNPVDRSRVAAKVVAAEDTWPGELEHWPNFDQENIVPLLDVVQVEGCNVFLTPLYPTSLQNVIHRSTFRSSRDCFLRTKTWIGDIATGLFYLHSLGVCHLNLQPSNIFLTMDQRAVIADFGCMDTTTRPVNSYGLPSQYSPPECWSGSMTDIRPLVLGIPYDLWSLGMIALNIWADHSLEHKTWSFYTHIFETLDFENFQRNFTSTFPNANVTENDLRVALNFMRGLLRTDAFQRPNTTRVLQHALLSGGNWTSWFITDPRWMDEETVYMNKECGDGIKNENAAIITTELTYKTEASGERVKRSGRKKGVCGWFRKTWKKIKAIF